METFFSGLLALLPTLCTSVIAALFLMASVGKLRMLNSFQQNLRSLPFVFSGADWVIARGIPILELAIAFGLLLGFYFATWSAVGLLLAFIGVALYAIRKRLSVPCNCFGNQQGTLSIGTIRRNFGLIAIALIGTLRSASPLSYHEVLYGFVILCIALSIHETWVASQLIRRLVTIGGLSDLSYRSAS